MSGWLRAVLVAVALMVGTWGCLCCWPVATARLLRDLAGIVPDCVTTGRAVALAVRYAARQVPRDVMVEARPGEARLLARLLGDQGPSSVVPR